MFNQYLKQVVSGTTLSASEAYHAANMLLSEDVSDIQAAAFLSALRTRRETEEELLGFVHAFLEHAVKIDPGMETLDTCGTGGDGKGTFNISTAAAFVVAACQVPVAKHGNRAITSQSGSADVLEAFGARIDIAPAAAMRVLEKTKITFLFAPHYHPIMKQVAPLRRGLGVPTLFNYLGPLLNPVKPSFQVMGVADAGIQGTVARTLSRMNRRRALVIHAENGMDEVSTDGPTLVHDVMGDYIRQFIISPESHGILRPEKEAIMQKSASDSAQFIMRIFDGEHGSGRDIVVLNAAAALMAAGKGSLEHCLLLAEDAIDSGQARHTLLSFIEATQEDTVKC